MHDKRFEQLRPAPGVVVVSKSVWEHYERAAHEERESRLAVAHVCAQRGSLTDAWCAAWLAFGMARATALTRAQACRWVAHWHDLLWHDLLALTACRRAGKSHW